MTKRDFEMKTDGTGIGLFAFGVFCAVLVVQAMLKGVDGEPVGLMKGLAALWVGSIGVLPSLALNVALAVLGARIFLAGAVTGVGRHVLGATLTAAGLAILCGAFGATAGGQLGAWIGGSIAGSTNAALGALVGAFAVAAAIWFVWLQRDGVPAEDRPLVRNPDVEEDEDGDTDSDEGVSRAEAEALLPVRIHPELTEARVARAPIPPSPYPEDVRRKGEIPPGARPIGSAPGAATPGVLAVASAAATGAQATTTYRWTAPAARKTETLAPLAPTQRTAGETRLVPDADERAGVASGDAEQDVEDARAVAQASSETALAPERTETLPRPPWEDDEEDLPVDAYGTPLSLVEALRKARGAAAAEIDAPEAPAVTAPAPEAQDALEDEDDPETGTPDPLLLAVEELKTANAPGVADEPLDDPAEVPEATEAPEELETLAEVDAEEDTEEETEADAPEAELEVLAELEPRSQAFVTETDEEDEDEEDELEDEPVELEPRARVERVIEPPEIETAGDAPAAPERGPEMETAQPSAPSSASVTSDAETPERAEAPRKAAERTRTTAPGLFDAPADEEPVSSVFAEEHADAGTEREVILTPPAVAAERTHKTPTGTLTGARTALLAEVGCLFIDRGRVAVSMLQRQYEMDFDEACKVLDELQDLGLIGPYLGGQRRDILLTREAWLEKVGTD